MKIDQQLQQDVSAELKWEPSVNAQEIDVEVKNGIVTLSGSVNSYAEKVDIATAAQRVAGVKGLAMDITVKLPETSQRSDSDIAFAAERVLSWTTYLEQDSIKIVVEKGLVTLSGEVHWDYERRSAVAVIRHLRGVIGVLDHIVIKEKVAPETVKSDIEAALKRRAINDAQAVRVVVKDADVILSGTVHSPSERDLIDYAAWNAKGVWNVINNIKIVA